MAPQESAANQPQPERYYREYLPLSTDEDSVGGILRGVINERSRCGWKLVSAIKEPGGDALLLEWDTLG